MTSITVSSVGIAAFASDVSLTSVTITSGEVGEFAFFGCTSLSEVILNEGVTKIGAYAFNGCSSLRVVIIPSTVVSIGDGAFADADFREIQLTNYPTIARSALAGNKLNTLLILPNGTRLTHYYLEEDDAYIPVKYQEKGEVPTVTQFLAIDSDTHICSGFLSDWILRPHTLVIPPGVQHIAANSFTESNITSLFTPSTLTTIGARAFSNCTGISQVFLGTNLKTICSEAFQNISISQIRLPGSLQLIETGAFANCVNFYLLAYRSLDNISVEPGAFTNTPYVRGVTTTLDDIIVTAKGGNAVDITWNYFPDPLIVTIDISLNNRFVTNVRADKMPVTLTLTDYILYTITLRVLIDGMEVGDLQTVFYDNAAGVLGRKERPDRSLLVDGESAIRMDSIFTIDRSQSLRGRVRMFGGLGVEISRALIDISGVATGDREITVSWTEPPAIAVPLVNYILTVTDTVSGVTWEITTESSPTSIVVRDLVAWDFYTFSVVPVYDDNSRGISSDPSEEIQAVSVPLAPTLPVLSLAGGSLGMDWVPPPSNIVAPILSYRIELVDISAGNSVTVLSNIMGRPYSTTNGGSRYKFRVLAANWIGEGPWSVYSDIFGPNDVPGAPTLVGVIVPARGQDISISWTVSENLGPPIQNYVLTVDGVSSTVTETTRSLLNHTYGVPVTSIVRARNVNGLGPESNTVVLTPLTVPGAPILTQCSAVDLTLDVSWDPPVFDGGATVTGYVFYFKNKADETIHSYNINDRNFVLENLDNGATYSVQISAINIIGEGLPCEWSPLFTVRIAGPPTVPLNAAVVDGGVSWAPPEDDGGAPILDYEVRIYTTSRRTYVYTVSTDRDLFYQIRGSGVPIEEVYSVLIAARNRVGRGPYAIAVPISQLEVSAIPSGDRSIRVTWVSPATAAGVMGITGFRVRYLFTGGGETEGILECSADTETIDVSGLTILNFWKGVSDGGGVVVDSDAERNFVYNFVVETLLDPSVYDNGVEGSFTGLVDCAPVTAPGQVENLSVAAIGGDCCEDLQISWDPPKYDFGGRDFVNDGGSPLVTYYVDVVSTYGVTRIPVLSSETLNLTFRLSDPGANVVRVSAANAYLTGPEVSSSPVGFTTLPDPPFDLQARAISSTEAIVTWRAPWNSGGVPIVSYDLEYFIDPTIAGTVRVSTESPITNKGFTGWSVENVYKIRVRTVTEKGVSIWTDYITFRISDDVPVLLSVVASREGDNIRVEWDDVVGATGYFLMMNINGDEVAGVPVYASVGDRLTDSTFTFSGEMLPLVEGIYRFRVRAVGDVGIGPWAYSNPVSVISSEGVVCFLGNAPVRTPTGWARIDSLSTGDLVRTADGRDVAVVRVAYQRVRATKQTSPYRIARGQFGATRPLLISPEHRVFVNDTMIEARHLGLPQVEWSQNRMIDYYNLELPDWERDNLIVAGVEVESLAPVRRIRVSYSEFAALLQEEFGSTITSDLVAQLRRRCIFYLDGTVEVPVIRPALACRH